MGSRLIMKSQDASPPDKPLEPGSGASHAYRFDRLLKAYGSAVMRLVSSYEANRADQDDLYQDICLAIWQALEHFREDCSERTFIYRIAHNRGITHRQRKKPTGMPLDKISARLPDHQLTPDVLHQFTRRYERLMAAVRQLPDIQRQIVILSLEELSHREIAEVIGTSEDNIAVRLNRAKKMLREILAEQEEK